MKSGLEKVAISDGNSCFSGMSRDGSTVGPQWTHSRTDRTVPAIHCEVSETSQHFHSVFGVTPPDGAYFCRVRLRLKGRVGNPPSIKCESLSEDAIQAEIDASEAFRRTLEAVDLRTPLGDRPWVLDADLQFFGSDGAAIDAPSKIEVTYFGVTAPKKDKKRKGSAEPREVAEALIAFMPSLKELVSATVKEATSAAKDSTALASANTTAHADVLKQALADLREAYKRDADRVDSAIEKMADSSNATTVQSGGSGGLSVIVDLLKIGKEAKSFLN